MLQFDILHVYQCSVHDLLVISIKRTAVTLVKQSIFLSSIYKMHWSLCVTFLLMFLKFKILHIITRVIFRGHKNVFNISTSVTKNMSNFIKTIQQKHTSVPQKRMQLLIFFFKFILWHGPIHSQWVKCEDKSQMGIWFYLLK